MTAPPAHTWPEPAQQLLLSIAALLALWGGWRSTQTFDSANSRLATAYSLVHHGTWYIDRPENEAPNRFEQATVDKVELNGRLLSTKPPLLPLLMTAEYCLLHKLCGWSLDPPDERARIVRCMNWTFAGLPYLLCLWFFAKLLPWFIAPPLPRFALLFALAFATQIPGYAVHINNHIPAAAALMAAIYLALGIQTGRLAPAPWRFFLFGLAGGITFAMDLPTAIFIAFLGLWLLYHHPRPTLFYAAPGLALPLLLHFALMLYVTGSPLPIQSRKELYLYEAAYWREPYGLDALNEPKLLYLFHSTFGRFGSFLLFPILNLGLASIICAVFRKNWPQRGLILAALPPLLILCAYYTLSTNNYGGSAYGFRWHITAMPLLLLLAAPLAARCSRPWHWVLLVLLLMPSLYSSYECFLAPWGSQHEWTCRWLFGPAVAIQ